MKSIFTRNEIVHVWAHGLARIGRTREGSISFCGDTIQSYDTDIARRVRRKGKTAVVFNQTDYSVTTNRHQSLILRAIPDDCTIFYIGNLGAGARLANVNNAQLLVYGINSAAECAEKAKRARANKDSYESRQSDWIESAKAICAFYGLRRKIDENAIERLRKSNERARMAEAKRRAEIEAQRIRYNTEKLSSWLAGKEVHFPSSIDKVYLRRVADSLQTSRGVNVSISNAKRAFRFALAYRNAEGWRRNGEVCRVGDYDLDAINENGIVAGCHRIEWDEIDRFAKLMGWNK